MEQFGVMWNRSGLGFIQKRWETCVFEQGWEINALICSNLPGILKSKKLGCKAVTCLPAL